MVQTGRGLRDNAVRGARLKKTHHGGWRRNEIGGCATHAQLGPLPNAGDGRNDGLHVPIQRHLEVRDPFGWRNGRRVLHVVNGEHFALVRVHQGATLLKTDAMALAKRSDFSEITGEIGAARDRQTPRDGAGITRQQRVSRFRKSGQ